MAFALTEPKQTAEDLVHVSIPILKWEQDDDGDLIVKGIATDGTLDSDDQVVSPEWSARALGKWLSTGGNVRMSHDAHRPVGKGLQVEVDKDGSGKHWVKSLIVDPLAQKLVKKGVLTAYSIGISRPVIKHDPTGRARGGIIVGGELAELSVVDRPSNKSSYLELAKSASDKTCEFTEKMFADDETIAEFGEADLVKADGVPGDAGDMSLTFTPNDLAKILKSKIIDQHYDELALKALYEAEEAVYKRNVSTAERRSLASEGNALPDGSYPIANAGDLHNAAHLARTGHGNAAAAKKLVARRAGELGVANPLNDNDSEDSGKGITSVVDETPEILKEADPVITKDPADGDKPKKPKKGKKLPPWLQDSQKADMPAKTDEDDEDEDACKLDHAHSEKCSPSGTPKSTSGAKDAADMQEIPSTAPAPESPMPAGRKTPDTKAEGSNPEMAALLRFKSIGIDPDLGRLHDLTCPAYDPDDVVKYHPYADFASLIDEDLWMRKAVDAACGPLDKAMELTQVWQAAQLLKTADMSELNDYRQELHKAFRDANPGPGSYPSPGSMSPQRFCRPVITGGHAANSPGYGSPNSSPSVASSAPNAHSFDRPPLESGHQSPSPSFMKSNYGLQDGYPQEQGVPSRLTYLHMEKDKARRALSMMHDHLSHQFPQGCPMIEQDAYRIEDGRGVPPIAGLGKTEAPAESVIKADALPDDFMADLEKGMRKKLGKKVLAGKMTVDEARSRLGRKVTQKAQEQLVELVEKGVLSVDEARAKLGLSPLREISVQAPPVVKDLDITYITAGDPNVTPGQIGELQKSLREMASENVIVLPYGTRKTESVPLEASNMMPDPDIIKSAVADAIAPLLAKIEQQDTALTKAQKEISEQEARWAATADLPDPRTASWAGLALNPLTKNAKRPAGVTTVAENAERTQMAFARQAYHTWRTSENPFEREAARTELDKFGFTD